MTNLQQYKYGTTIPITKDMRKSRHELIQKAIKEFKNCNGQYLMRSLYRGKGRPRKCDYRQYYSRQDLEDLKAMDMLNMSFIANYLSLKDV